MSDDDLRSSEAELAERLRESANRTAEYRRLREDPAFQGFLEFLTDQLRQRRDSIELAETTGLDDLVSRERVFGEIAALRLAVDFVPNFIRDSEEAEAVLRDQLKIEQEILQEEEDE